MGKVYVWLGPQTYKTFSVGGKGSLKDPEVAASLDQVPVDL